MANHWNNTLTVKGADHLTAAELTQITEAVQQLGWDFREVTATRKDERAFYFDSKRDLFEPFETISASHPTVLLTLRSASTLDARTFFIAFIDGRSSHISYAQDHAFRADSNDRDTVAKIHSDSKTMRDELSRFAHEYSLEQWHWHPGSEPNPANC